MVVLKKYNLTGQEVGEVKINDGFVNVQVNEKMIKDYIVAIRENKRQWSASTKGRSEINRTKKKPFRQKGTGGARHGSFSAPIFVGGGRAFGPKPKFDQHVRINKKERQKVIHFLIAEKMKEQKVHILQEYILEKPKTKTIANFVASLQLGKRVLFLFESKFTCCGMDGMNESSDVGCKKHKNLYKSIRNIPKKEFLLATNVNGYKLMFSNDIVVTEQALEELQDWLGNH